MNSSAIGSDKELPNFIIVGTAKSGTTSLHYYLQQHPEIYMPKRIKETFFFIQPKTVLGIPLQRITVKTIDTFDAYKQLYQDVDLQKHKAIGEATPIYLLFHKVAIPLIKKYLNHPKIIAILRNPIDRAFSNYLHHIRDGIDHVSFSDALKLEAERKAKNFWYSYRLVEIGFYYHQIKAYMDNFSDVKVLIFDQFKHNPLETLKAIFSFLEVDSDFIPDTSQKHNITGLPRCNLLHNILTEEKHFLRTAIKPFIQDFLPRDKLITVMNRIREKNLGKPILDKQLRNQLVKIYREDIQKLQPLIHKDLSHWLTISDQT